LGTLSASIRRLPVQTSHLDKRQRRQHKGLQRLTDYQGRNGALLDQQLSTCKKEGEDHGSLALKPVDIYVVLTQHYQDHTLDCYMTLLDIEKQTS
jgi:hypothetical protein